MGWILSFAGRAQATQQASFKPPGSHYCPHPVKLIASFIYWPHIKVGQMMNKHEFSWSYLGHNPQWGNI